MTSSTKEAILHKLKKEMMDIRVYSALISLKASIADYFLSPESSSRECAYEVCDHCPLNEILCDYIETGFYDFEYNLRQVASIVDEVLDVNVPKQPKDNTDDGENSSGRI